MRRKIDNRIRVLIDNGCALGHRTFVVIVGNKSMDQVIYLHHMLSKSSLKQATVLWCYKKELNWSSHKKKRMKQLEERMKVGLVNANENDPLEVFVSMTDIRYCYYKDTHKILGNTYKMCVLQDFEAITPNLLCRTIETVEGGGLIVLLLQTVTSLRQLYTLSMDVHARYRNEAYLHLVPRFNERFILSLASCSTCVVVDDHLRILPLSSHLRDLQPVPPVTAESALSPQDQELKEIKASLKDTPPIGIVVGLCKTRDQAKVVLEFVLTITEKLLNTTVTLTAARGRGKSAAMGLAIASAIAFGYSNIYVTSPSPENLKTLFEFLICGLNALGYEEHMHYQVVRSVDPQFDKCIVRVTVKRDHRQTVQYINPGAKELLGQAELLVIDEAAAIPLPQVRGLLGPYLVFMASTVSGYEGTGRSLSLKLIDQLRQQTKSDAASGKEGTVRRKLKELKLEESIRYRNGDPVEAWLHSLLCLAATGPCLIPHEDIPAPSQCELFYVNRDTLFGYHELSEKFLSQIMGLLVASHYRNTPDDLQILSDAPGHHIFVLLPAKARKGDELPPVFCVIQVALEGKISKSSVMSALTKGEKPAGDLIPWTVSNLFQNFDFPQLSGLRIVRIATLPELQGRGYGSQAVALLEACYRQTCDQADFDCTPTPEVSHMKVVQDEEVSLLEEKLLPNKDPLPLLTLLHERTPEALHYIGVSYGASSKLLSFWKRNGYTSVYLSQVPSDITGEHTIIMLKILGNNQDKENHSWLSDIWFDFRRRLTILLGCSLKSYDCKFALSILMNSSYKKKPKAPSAVELQSLITSGDISRLEEYSRHQCEAALISDIIPSLSKMYFLGKIPDLRLKPVQAAVLCGIGIQRKTVAELCSELGVEKSIIMSQFHILITNLLKAVRTLFEKSKNEPTETGEENSMVEDLTTSIQETAKVLKLKETDEREKVRQLIDFTPYEIKTKEDELLHSKKRELNVKKKLKLMDLGTDSKKSA